MRVGYLAAVAVAAMATAAAAQTGGTTTLREALVKTYATNPTIMAQRAQLRSLDEGVAIARAGRRPQIAATAGVNQNLLRTGGGGIGGRNFNAGVDLSMPIFEGGRTSNRIGAANERVAAGRAALRATEGDVFVDAVSAYMDVIRDRIVVNLNQGQVRVLETNLQATRDRFEVGDLTRTDVAQSEARLALARSALAGAEGRLRGSEEAFRRVIGELPVDLQPPPPLPPLPRSEDEAVDIALANNPDLISIAAQIRAAGRDVRAVEADRLPTVSGVGSGGYTNYLGTADQQFGGTGNNNSIYSTAVGIQARIPIYQGGVVGARVRQGQAIQSQLLERGIETERFVVAVTRAAFASYRAAQEAIASNEIAVAANTLALEGTRAEQTVGTRNVLDVLNAEQELLNARTSLVNALTSVITGSYALAASIGRLTAQDLGLPVEVYDMAAYYNAVRNRWVGLGDYSTVSVRR
jgi:outer membrane protein